MWRIKEMSSIKKIMLVVGIFSLVMGVIGLLTGEALEPSRHGKIIMRDINDDEAAFATVIFWRFILAILCFTGLWVFRKREHPLY